ncbi:chemotaxis protein CheY [Palaeococcus pacificus DY20341]|uniref:Chemotaxis protein CheY n=1 Tax=Palaeococcus pacificus DY20341 TaxID=1343739 RepID=A0A075LTM7_9EURY|nr:response regulator [Palaeococcus pacificus]AIF69317.1 chemotaxis protein CheY [Palaeococcus pacificus DY20341]
MARILVVDDAAFMRMLLKKILTQAGHQVIGEASNGEEAIEKYKELKPDLVTMDIIMPKMDGISAVGEIVKIDQNAKVVMITAVGQEAKVMKALKNGAKGYIVKPFQAPKVIEEINRILSG